jgi:hypothetical protein
MTNRRRSKMVATNVNWDVEIAALQDLSVTVSTNHRLTMDALVRAFQEATEPLDQKVLTARLAAEGLAALEHVGALGWALSKRHDQGILRRYLSYETEGVRDFYLDVQARQLRDVFRLPERHVVASSAGDDDASIFEGGLVALQTTLRTAAGNYFALGGKVVKTYNKIKHGFPVIIRMDKLIPGKVPPTNWEQNVNVLTDITADGRVEFTDLERSAGMLDRLRNGIEGCANAWREAAFMVLFMWERGVPLIDPSALSVEGAGSP